jgi:hypothetical protein
VGLGSGVRSSFHGKVDLSDGFCFVFSSKCGGVVE